MDRWRKGNNVFSKHYVHLSDALKGCEVTVPMVYGDHSIKITDMGIQTRHLIAGKGAKAKAQKDADRIPEELK